MFYGSQSFGTSKYGGKNEVSVLLFVSISDGLTIAENLTGELKSLISIFDGLIIVENLTEELKFFVNIENQITIEESVIKFLQLGNIVAYDELTIIESPNIDLLNLINKNEILTIAENLTIGELKFFVNIENQITIEESVIKFLQLGNIVAYDELTIIESPNIDLLNLINKNEILTITEDTTRENFRFSPSIKIPIGIKKVGL